MAQRFFKLNAGRSLDYSEAGTGVPVVHVKVATMLAEQAPGDVQLIPADIEGHPGQYLVFVATHLRIDKSKVGNAKVFRPEGWPTALIVAEEIKDALEAMGATGTRCQEV
jgi:hypothetical protein